VGGPESVQLTLDGVPRSLAPLTHSSPAARRRARMRMIVLIGTVAAAAVAAVVFTRSPEAKPMAVTSPAPATEEPAPAALTPTAHTATVPAAEPTQRLGVQSLVAVDIKVAPEGARVTLDGAPITVPFSGQFRRDNALHHLEVSASGHRPLKQLVAFDQDRVIDVVLERAPERAPPAPARRAQANDKSDKSDKPAQAAVEPAAPKAEPVVAPSAPPASSGAPGEDLKSVRPRVTRGRIDSNDPYSQNN
jgi:hypothetical protein